jgi:hypothetical protein
MENENDLILNVDTIKVVQGSITFPEFVKFKSMALKLADALESIEVTEDTLKASKAILAAVNKRVKQLEDERIKIKKSMLEPYQEFEDQVKEIVAIVKNADEIVRQQVKDLENTEREKKQHYLADIFHKRKAMYTLGDLIPFEDFLKPKHLNKSISVDQVEREMIEFLEQTEKDIKVLQKMPDLNAHVSAYIGAYDLADAMAQVQQEKQRRQQIEATHGNKEDVQAQKHYRFKVFGEKDATLVKMFMRQNKIQYEEMEQ